MHKYNYITIKLHSINDTKMENSVFYLKYCTEFNQKFSINAMNLKYL